ncbi:hypothetical protein [Nonomuraea sp. KM90]|uniref:hypothetical protein n=1 Tax=Nonomuraea sp. KM90 TaxID=3457428 RepID=UPI003FCEA30F
MTADEPTLGEVVRSLARIERDLGTRFDGITARLDRVITVELYEAHQKAVEQRFVAVESEATDLKEQRLRDDEKRTADRRMVVGALITAKLSPTIIAAALLLALGL